MTLPNSQSAIPEAAIEMPEAIRLPLHSLQADAGYMFGSVVMDGTCAPAMANSVLDRLRQLEAAIRAILPAPAPIQGDVAAAEVDAAAEAIAGYTTSADAPRIARAALLAARRAHPSVEPATAELVERLKTDLLLMEHAAAMEPAFGSMKRNLVDAIAALSLPADDRIAELEPRATAKVEKAIAQVAAENRDLQAEVERLTRERDDQIARAVIAEHRIAELERQITELQGGARCGAAPHGRERKWLGGSSHGTIGRLASSCQGQACDLGNLH